MRTKNKMRTKIKTPKKLKIPVNSAGTKSDANTGKIANTRHLKRILVYLQEVVDYSWHNDIRANCCMPPNKVLDATTFLLNHNLIKTRRGFNGGKIIYYLPEKELLVEKAVELEGMRHRLKYKKKGDEDETL